MRGALMVVALAGAACGEELAAALRAQLQNAAPGNSQVINVSGSTGAGATFFFGDGGGPSISSSSSTTSLTLPDIPIVCQGTCPSTFQGKPLPFAVTQVTSQGVQYCVPSPATVSADGTISSTFGGKTSAATIFTPGVTAAPQCSSASAVSPVIMAIVGVLLSMLL